MNYVSCAHCGTTLEQTAELAGTVVRCPHCMGELTVPAIAPPVAHVVSSPFAPTHYHRQPARPNWGPILAVLLPLIIVGAPVVTMFVCCGGCINSIKNTPQSTSASARPQQATRSGKLAVEVVDVRLEPFRTATGLDRYTVLVDWKNVGDRPVRGVRADIKAFDEHDNELYFVSNYYIYAGNNDGPGIVPGGTYSDPHDDGHILLTASIPARATVKITSVEETGY